MSFQYVPSQFRLPKVPNWTPPAGFWCGLGSDKGRCAFACSGWGGGYVMTDGDFCCSLVIGSSTLKPVYSSVNGYVYWEGNGYVYCTRTYGWVWSNLFPGYEPVEDYTYDKSTDTYTGSGDTFYTLDSFPDGDGAEENMTGRGAAWGKTKTVKATWKRWTSYAEFGKYSPADGATGDRYLGLPRFRGSNGATYVRSFAKTDGHYTYGDIHYADDRWLIGEYGSDAGWHEGDEPSKESPVTFTFTKNKGSEAEGTDITVTYRDCVKGDERANVFLGEAAIWR